MLARLCEEVAAARTRKPQVVTQSRSVYLLLLLAIAEPSVERACLINMKLKIYVVYTNAPSAHAAMY